MATVSENSHRTDCLVVWRIVDGKAGHEAQTAGLVKALEQRIPISCHDIAASSGLKPIVGLLMGSYPHAQGLPKPDLILGAGHRTHLTVIAAKRSYGGISAVLMRPSLPTGFFDFCFIPQHDSPKTKPNVLATRGVLNTITPASELNLDRGLILVGGPSKHHGWDSDDFLKRIVSLVEADPQVDWRLTTSRRTPPSCAEALLDLSYANLKVTPVEDTPRGWVAERLQECGKVWVSSDSISMIYESLTAGACVGLIEAPVNNPHARVVRETQRLVDEGLLVLDGSVSRLPVNVSASAASTFDEAGRCADFLLSRLSRTVTESLRRF